MKRSTTGKALSINQLINTNSTSSKTGTYANIPPQLIDFHPKQKPSGGSSSTKKLVQVPSLQKASSRESSRQG
jgi:hypothetical protein